MKHANSITISSLLSLLRYTDRAITKGSPRNVKQVSEERVSEREKERGSKISSQAFISRPQNLRKSSKKSFCHLSNGIEIRNINAKR